MITNISLIEEFKKYLDDPYVYYCGCGVAFEKARKKTVEIVYDIPYCFSIIGVLQKHFLIDEVYMVGYKESEKVDKKILEKFHDATIVYTTSDRSQVVAALYNNNEIIRFCDGNEYKFNELVFDNDGNIRYITESDRMLGLLASYVSDTELESINGVMYRTIRDWKEKDDLYNMMY